MFISKTTRRPLVVLTTITLLAALWIGAPVASQEGVPESGEYTLVILHNNDGESKLLEDQDSGFPGAARFAALVKQLQSQAGGAVITLTSGDNFLASQELGVSLARENAPLYDSVALSGLYDAMALGNHDFDLGPEVTARFIEGFTPPVPFLSANLDFSGEPSLAQLVADGLLAASVVIETGGERIGVIGAVTPWLGNISSPRNVGISAVLPAVAAEAAKLTADGVNKIILVSHLQDVDEEVALVADLTDVDVVIAGGGDDLLRNEGDSCMPDEEPAGPYPMRITDASGAEVPVITAPGGYRCIGELSVTFDAEGNITRSSGRSIGVGFDVVPDSGVQAGVIDPLTAAVAEIDADVIGVSQVDLDGRRSMVRTTDTNVGNLLADALRTAASHLAAGFGISAPQVAVTNGGGIRNDSLIPAGDVTTGITWDIAPFNNFVVVGEISRETLRALLERAVSSVPGAGGQFAQVSGFTFDYDPTAAAREVDRSSDCSVIGSPGERVRNVTLDDGTVIVRNGSVVPGAPVVLAIVDFLARGGDCYPLREVETTRLGVTYQQALAEYIAHDLGGVIGAADYPTDGGDRITALAPTEAASTRSYTVRPGDTLRKIAQSLLGSELRWPEIFALNEGNTQADGRTLTNPDLIHIDWILEIPAD